MNLTFTFQSGYIQILFPIYWHYLLYFLYIPIWLYSNNATIDNKTNVTPFTFQSGYIQIRSPIIWTIILLTLHSNLVIFKLMSSEKVWLYDNLYIPIWLYSNNNQCIFTRCVFTLHSNLVIFKWEMHLIIALYMHTLHSNLVIFKSDW